jgi:hypothetical protein
MPRTSTEISARKSDGAHYTPTELTRRVVREALDLYLGYFQDHKDILAVRMCDPACGDGNLLGCAAIDLSERLESTPKHRALRTHPDTLLGRVLRECVHGNDLREDAAAAARDALPVAAISVGDGLDWQYPVGRLCVIMNPPFLGGSKISGALGKEMHAKTRELTGSGRTDLAVAFLRSAARVVETQGGTLSAILPSALTEGDNRVFGLAVLLARGWKIMRAETKQKWPGDAKVMFVVVHMTPPSDRQ